MCGIAGEIRFDAAPDAAAVARMAGAIVHRGPDAEGFFTEGPAALGHRRLSILDLEGGVQPMTREGVTLVFNGQAYEHDALRDELRQKGHPFTTRSDTEVVLRAYLEWGEGFVEHVYGMFAIALWDAPRRRAGARPRPAREEAALLRARRRAGVGERRRRPLGAADGRDARCSSDPSSRPSSLMAPCRGPSTASPSRATSPLEYVPSPRSIFAGVRKLPAAHVAVLDAKGFRLRRYWEIPAPSSSGGGGGARVNGAEAATELRACSTSPWRAASWPTCRWASSSAAASTPPPSPPSRSAITAAWAASPSASRRRASTSRATPRSPRASSARCTTSRCSRARPASTCSPRWPRRLDEPFGDPSILPTHLLSRFARGHVKVALAGDGGDELFAGYDPFLAHRPATVAVAPTPRPPAPRWPGR